MNRALRLGLPALLACACHDFDADYQQCLASGNCLSPSDAGADGGSGADGGPGLDGGTDGGDSGVVETQAGFCGSGGWCWENPLPSGWTVNALYVLSETNAWMAGEDGLVGQFDGQVWTQREPLPPGPAFTALWADSTDAWALAGSNVWWWNGTSWSAPVNPVPGPFTGVWGSSSSNVWVTGTNGAALWNGSAFMSGGVTASNIFGASSSAIWATAVVDAGEWGLVYFDGGGWGPAGSLALSKAPTGLWADDAGHVWVANPLGVAREDGHFELDGGACQSVWGDNDGGLWATCSPPLGNVMARLSTGTWEQLIASFAEASSPLETLHGADPQSPWVGGVDGLVYSRETDGTWLRRTQGPLSGIGYITGFGAGSQGFGVVAQSGLAMLERSGTQWESVLTVAAQNSGGVWADAPDDIWALTDTGLIYFDGGTWGQLPGPGVAASVLWGTGPNDLWAGDSSNSQSPLNIWRWSQGTWTGFPLDGGSYYVNDIHGTGPNDVWAATGNQVFHWDGGEWAGQVIPAINWAYRIHENTPTDVWVVDNAGSDYPHALNLFRWNGQSWTRMGGGPLPILVSHGYGAALWGTGPDDVWIGGANGQVVHWDGGQLSGVIQTATQQDLYGLWSAGPTAPVFAAGAHGAIVRFDR